MKRAIAIVSGGLDSVTLAYLLKSLKYDLHLLSFDYGQRHIRELDCASDAARRLGAQHSIVKLDTLTHLLRGSALTDASVDVPSGHYADATMRVTVVPNRNAIMLAIAYAVAVAEQADVVAIGVHAGDHTIYPDCRPAFVESFERMQRLATEGFARASLTLFAPFVDVTKTDIVSMGANLGVPFEDTWSCYRGSFLHCGTCGTCVERRSAFADAGIVDPTTYQFEEET